MIHHVSWATATLGLAHDTLASGLENDCHAGTNAHFTDMKYNDIYVIMTKGSRLAAFADGGIVRQIEGIALFMYKNMVCLYHSCPTSNTSLKLLGLSLTFVYTSNAGIFLLFITHVNRQMCGNS